MAVFVIFHLLFTEPFQVHRNLSSGVVKLDDSWAFGQVLAVVMVLANANEILHFFFGFLARRKLRLARERQEQTEEIGLRPAGQSAPAFYGSRGPSGSNVSSRVLHEPVQERILNHEFPARDQSTDKISTGNERQCLDKRNTEVSETIVVSNLQAQDQPIGTLR